MLLLYGTYLRYLIGFVLVTKKGASVHCIVIASVLKRLARKTVVKGMSLKD